MKLLTKKQIKLICRNKIKVGSSFMFPQWGFEIYAEPNYGERAYMDTNPLTKSLDSQRFKVKEITDNGFCRGNFEHKPKGRDMYMRIEDLESRPWFIVLIIGVVCILPMLIYNAFSR